jgi:Holliday junction DNA helicase RuvA
MITHLNGTLIEKNPSYLVIECNGVGYMVHISLHTFGQIPDKGHCKVLTYMQVREDEHKLFGFAQNGEREIFKQLISVSGVGASTAQTMLSSMGPDQVTNAILNEEAKTLQSIKGIGGKTAQRVIVDLKDKLARLADELEFSGSEHNTTKQEALSALTALGFDRKSAEKSIDKVLKNSDELSVEELVKQALKSL